MKILFVVPYVPNLIRVRPYNIIRSLTDLGHSVTVLTLWVNDEDRKDIDALQAVCDEVLATQMPTWKSALRCLVGYFSGEPLQSFYSWEPKLVDLVDDVEQFDMIHVEHLRGSRYGLHFLENTNVPVVWDSVDSISHLFKQAVNQSKSFFGSIITKLDLRRTEKFEGWLVNQFETVLVTSTADKHALLALSKNSTETPNIIVLPNGVNLDYFRPDKSVKRDTSTLVVTGKMSYHANVTMVLNLVDKIMPKVWEKVPETKLYVVGKDPSPEILEAGKKPNIVVTGTVDDMRPYLHKATVAVAPVVYGAGIQNKVLEAMACGVPVITTPQSAQAITAVPNEEFCIADIPDEFASKTIELIDNPVVAGRIGEAGHQFLRKNHDWLAITGRLEEIYDGIIGN
ncbi:MAG: glycosyltransferase [Chloroflexota bacterium]